MKVTLRSIACGLALAACARAGFPLEDMGPRSLGLQYGLAFRGQNITNAAVPSHEIIHTLTMAYAPVLYLALEGGLGLDKLVVETENSVGFRGDFGFSPTFGFTLTSPYFASNLVRVTAGARALYLNSEDEIGFRYSGFISNPFLGVVVSPSGAFDVEAGVRGHLMDGTMHGPGGVSKPFSNQDAVRGYLAVSLKAPAEHAFFTLDLDMSPDADSDWSRGPREAQVGISFGALLGWKKEADGADSSKYFPDFPSLRERLRKMAGEAE